MCMVLGVPMYSPWGAYVLPVIKGPTFRPPNIFLNFKKMEFDPFDDIKLINMTY